MTLRQNINIFGKLKKSELTSLGYHLNKPINKRRIALIKAIHIYGNLSVFRKLNVLSVLFKNTHPDYSKIAKADAKWVIN